MNFGLVYVALVFLSSAPADVFSSLWDALEGMMLKLKLQYFGHLCEELTHWKRLWCWEGLGTGGEGDDRGWDGWMASRTRWMWVWVNSGSWWWTGRPGVLRFMLSQRVVHNWATELNWTDFLISIAFFRFLIPICSLLHFLDLYQNSKLCLLFPWVY